MKKIEKILTNNPRPDINQEKLNEIIEVLNQLVDKEIENE